MVFFFPSQWLQLDQLPLISLPLALFFFVPIIFLYLKNAKSSQSEAKLKKSYNLPPSPPKLPIIGNLHQVGTLPHRSLNSLSQKYGPLMLLNMGRTPTVVFSSAEMAKEIMKNHDLVFSNRPITSASKAFVWGNRDVAFASYGEYWRQVRKICIVDLLSVKRVQSYRFVREEEISDMISKLREACVKGEPVDLGRLVFTLTNNIISRIAIGRKFEREEGGVKTEFADIAKESMGLFGDFSVEDMFPSLWWIDRMSGLDRRMKTTAKQCHQFLEEVIDEHMARVEFDDVRKDFVDILLDRQKDLSLGIPLSKNDLKAIIMGVIDEHMARVEFDDARKDFVDILLDRQKDLSLGIPLSKNDLKAIIMDMFIAGTDTTYTTLEWAMAELMRHPKVMKKVQEDIRSVVKNNKPTVDEDDINQMHYLNCVIKEALRLHPPAPLVLPRVSSASTKIGTFDIPAKARAIVNVWAIARDPKIWDNPDEFIPDRFIGNPIDYKGLDFDYLPFGAGRRGCPGIVFGMTSVETVLVNLLYWFDWELPCDGRKVDLESETFGLNVRLKYPLHLVPISHELPS